MGIGDLVITIADDLIGSMYGIGTDSRHLSCSQGCKDIASGLEVYSVMEKHFSCLGMLLLAIAKRHLHILVTLLKGHTVAAC